MRKRDWPAWWRWELELSSHLLDRMEDRGFTEVELRVMLVRARSLSRDIVPGRWRVITSLKQRRWDVIVEPDSQVERLVVVTAYPVRES